MTSLTFPETLVGTIDRKLQNELYHTKISLKLGVRPATLGVMCHGAKFMNYQLVHQIRDVPRTHRVCGITVRRSCENSKMAI